VGIWESDPETFSYYGSGYIALGDGAQESDLASVYERQQRIGYDSELIAGEAEVADHMRTLFPDWRAPGLSVCLHEHQGGFAFNRDSMLGLASKAVAAGASIEEGVEVTGFELDSSGAVKIVETSAGAIAAEQVVVAAGPWTPHLWELLGLPRRLEVAGVEQEMWTFWYLQEGEIEVDPRVFVTANGSVPPVLHVDSHAPLHADDGSVVTEDQWGVYFKQDKSSVQGGAAPLPQGHEFQIDPYPTGSVEAGFPDLWCAALSHCMERFEGSRPLYRQVRSGGVGAFTADNFPVFDYMRPNVFVVADSNHGYKMIAVGREVARVLGGEHSALLHPFRYERFATGDLHPVSNSPYPWS
jgi:methylglutamate dehydrogenase subunit A